MKKINESKLMVIAVILLLITVGVLYAKSDIKYKKADLKEALAAGSSSKGECYINWDGINCREGFIAIKKGKLTIVTDPSVSSYGCEYQTTAQTGYGNETINVTGICAGEINIGAGDNICANIPDMNELETWGLVVEQSNFDCSICCKI